MQGGAGCSHPITPKSPHPVKISKLELAGKFCEVLSEDYFRIFSLETNQQFSGSGLGSVELTAGFFFMLILSNNNNSFSFLEFVWKCLVLSAAGILGLVKF